MERALGAYSCAKVGVVWYKDYLGLGNRLIFYPYSSLGNTFTCPHAADDKKALSSFPPHHVRFVAAHNVRLLSAPTQCVYYLLQRRRMLSIHHDTYLWSSKMNGPTVCQQWQGLPPHYVTVWACPRARYSFYLCRPGEEHPTSSIILYCVGV